MRYADGKYKEKSYTVYMHTTPNNKHYIGLTCQRPECRWNDGDGYKTQKLFWRAIKKYGWENISHTIIKDNISFEEAKQLEKDMIQYYQSNNPKYGYNLTSGGEGVTGVHLSDAQRKTISERMKNRIVSKETCKKISLSKRGKKIHFTEEQLKAIGERAKHIHHPKRTEEQRTYMSEVAKKMYANGEKPHHCKPHTEEAKRKISEKQKGRVISDETKEKLRQAAIRQWERQHKQKQIKEELL